MGPLKRTIIALPLSSRWVTEGDHTPDDRQMHICDRSQGLRSGAAALRHVVCDSLDTLARAQATAAKDLFQHPAQRVLEKHRSQGARFCFAVIRHGNTPVIALLTKVGFRVSHLTPEQGPVMIWEAPAERGG
jgi:hypothetical protein